MDQLKFQTFGCKVNTYDTGLLQSRLLNIGVKGHSDRPIHVLNSCAVTAEASKEVVRAARKIKRTQSEALVVVTGCSAQVDTEILSKSGDIDLIIANTHKGEIAELLQAHLDGRNQGRIFKSNIFSKNDLDRGGGLEAEHTRSFLKIQDGCNSFCTFCVIPFARGKSRSIEPDDLVRRICELEAQGIKEVVLTGVHIGDYQSEKGVGLSHLVEIILCETRVPRIRLSSLEPVELTAELLRQFENPRVCPHFHMSIQSATSSVLRAMKRKYTAYEVEQALTSIADRFPYAFVGMDVIAGFPGESEEDFAETIGRLSELPWSRIHVFPYSERPLTYAARLPDRLRREVIMDRSARLRALSDERYRALAVAQVGTTHRALVLGARSREREYGDKGSSLRAISDSQWSIELDKPRTQGEEILVRIVGYDFSRKETGLRGISLG